MKNPEVEFYHGGSFYLMVDDGYTDIDGGRHPNVNLYIRDRVPGSHKKTWRAVPHLIGSVTWATGLRLLPSNSE